MKSLYLFTLAILNLSLTKKDLPMNKIINQKRMIKLKQRINWIIREYKFGIEFGNDSAVFYCNKRKVELEEYEEIKNKLIQEISTEDDFSNSNQHKSSDIEEQLYFYTVTSEVNDSEESLHFSFNDSTCKIEITHTYPKNFDKYCILEEGKKFVNNHVYPIMAMRTFLVRDHILVIMGEIGGWVEKEENLSQQDNCWIAGNSVAMHDSKVSGDSYINGSVIVTNNAVVSGNAFIKDHCSISGNAIIDGDVTINGNSYVTGNAKITGKARLVTGVRIFGDAILDGNIKLSGVVTITDSKLTGDINLAGYYCFNEIEINGDSEFVAYRVNVSIEDTDKSHDYLLASTVKDYWSTRSFHGNSEELYEHVRKSNEENCFYFHKLIEMHKHLYDI